MSKFNSTQESSGYINSTVIVTEGAACVSDWPKPVQEKLICDTVSTLATLQPSFILRNQKALMHIPSTKNTSF